MSVFALMEKLAALIESEMKLVINTKEEAEALYSKLERIQVGLQEAERKGVTDKGVKGWLKQLEAVTYEMDDVLDEWEAANHQVEVEAANLQVDVQDTSLNWDRVCSLLDSLCSCGLCFKQVESRREITLKMKASSVRIDTILSQKPEYTLVPSETQEFKQEESTSPVDVEFKTYGLDDVKNSLVGNLVFEGEVSDKDTQVISIVGVGGVGKTTLAQLAYNDPQVDGLFDLKGWVSVSQSFDVSAIAKAILETFGEKRDDANTLDTIVTRIKKAVENKRFLLVLDNVWVENLNNWESLRNCLQGGKGSRIVVTTRLQTVARMMGTAEWQSLGLLSDLDCGRILNGVALGGRQGKGYKILEGIGMEIAKKCNGLPLAAKSIGSMLKLRTFSEKEWRKVLESPIWMTSEGENKVFSILNLCYTDLSPLLKRCFLSSVVFPKGSVIRSDEIIRLWMAYGYLNSNGEVDDVALKGSQYLNDLAMRSFFQSVARDHECDNIKSFKMHDIMHDFATHLSESDGNSFIMHGGLEMEKSSSSKSVPDYSSRGKLRTLCVHKEELRPDNFISELRPDIISNLTSVRVLSLRDCKLEGLPEEIGKLIHLRYLNVSENPIRKLPETIGGLCNLQTLDIERCGELSSLPEGMGKLINLRHLLNTDTVRLVEYPQGMDKLSGLQTLSEIRGGKLGFLRNMNQLQGSLSLTIEDFDEGEFGEPNLWEKQHIEMLILLAFIMKGRSVERVDKMVEALKPPPNLQILWVESHESTKWLSRWITSFHNVKIVGFGFNRCPDQPPLYKLPVLEELTIFCCDFKRLSLGFVGDIEDGNSRQVAAAGFPKLKKLRFVGCGKWEEWEDIEQESSVPPVFPSLQVLEIKWCYRLKGLPHNLLGKASSLRIVKIFYSKGLYARYNEESGYDRHSIPPNQTWTVVE